MAYEFINSKGTKYYLHSKTVKLKGSNIVRDIYYFAREVRKEALDEIPANFKVVESKRSGLPVLKRIK